MSETKEAPRFPEVCDLVAVSEKSVDYYGYVDDIDFDPRSLRVCVEFFPGNRQWFDLSEIRRVNYPEPHP